MKREFLVALGGAAIVIAGMSGCSSDKASTESNGTTAASGSTEAKVVVDGKEQKIEGSIGCTTAAGNVSIGFGQGATGIAAVLSEGDSPTVQSVALGNVDGISLGYTAGAGGEAKAEKDGNTYKISGTATGMDMKNPGMPTEKPFEMEFTCP